MKMKTAGAALMLIVSAAQPLQAAIPEDRAIKAVIGEAENQGPRGMLAVACALRNRGTLKGVYGYHAIEIRDGVYVRVSKKGSRRIPSYIVKQAKAAWALSLKRDITHGANFWENVAAFGIPEWSKGMTKTFEHEGHVFFKGAL